MILTADEINAESFETWNAKQHGDPEEIGFLQALRIAYCHGQDSMKKAVERAVLEKLCAGVSMPEHAVSVSPYEINTIFWEAGHEYAGLSSKLFTADQLRAYGAACRLKALEDAAMLATPLLPRPCDCEVCDCGNSGDHARVVDWDSSNGLAKAIRALRGEA